jgi:ABC-2 type transport system ATP-binding protein
LRSCSPGSAEDKMDRKYTVITKALTRKYNTRPVVNNLNLRVTTGEVFGLLGPDGAGKTTTILMLLGLIEPTSGNALVCGYNPVTEPIQVKRTVGYISEQTGFYEDMTVGQNLRFISEVNRIPNKEIDKNIDEALETVGIRELAEQQVKKLSVSQKRNLGIADAIVKKPALLILDEPTAGLNAEAAESICELVSGLSGPGTTVIIASSQLYKMQKLCSRVGIMSNGKLVIEASTVHMSLKSGEGHYRIDIETKVLTPDVINRVKTIKEVIETDVRENNLMVTARSDIRSELSRIMSLANLPVLQMKIFRLSLNDIYMKYFRDKEQ